MITPIGALARAGALVGLVSLAGCASVMTAWQSASNRDMTTRVAPALQSTVWIHPGADAATPAYNGRWTLLVFFDTRSKSTAKRFPEINAIQETYRGDGVVVFGITEVDHEKTTFFLEDHPATFSVLTEAQVDRIAFGIKNLYEPVVYLVDPYQRILARGFEDARSLLQENFGH